MAKDNTTNVGLLARFKSGFSAFIGSEQRYQLPINSGFSGFQLNSESGAKVSEETALKLSAVYAAARNISEDIGKIPFSIYDKEGDFKNVEQRTHSAFKIIKHESSPGVPTYVLKSSLVASALLRGDGFAYIQRDKKGIVKSIIYLPYDCVTIMINDKNEIGYKVSEIKNNLSIKAGTYPSTDIIHIRGFSTDGIRGMSVIQYGANSLGLAISAQDMASKVYKNGSTIGGFLEADRVLKPEEIKNIQNSFNASSGGTENAYKWKLLEGGIKANPIKIDIQDSQLLDTRKFSVAEIARWFRMPLHKIQDMTGATFSNIEEQNIEYATDTLSPWVSKLEQEFLFKLCTEKEIADGYFVRGNLEEILRGNTAARTQYYKEMTYIGAISTDEIRGAEFLNPVTNGSDRYIPANMMVLKPDGQILVPNINPNNQPKD